MSFELDTYDRKILALLQENARMSLSEIGRRIHLTSPAVGERVKRLEEAGVIEGYGARLNLRAMGYSFEAFINVIVDSHDELDAWARAHPEVLALHATTGAHCAAAGCGNRARASADADCIVGQDRQDHNVDRAVDAVGTSAKDRCETGSF